jgi:CubicO group peptidase (beta-lactamase class C family)
MIDPQKMSYRPAVVLLLALHVLPRAAGAVSDISDLPDLSDLLEPIRKEHGLPALTAAAVKSGRIVGLGAVGSRKAGSPEPVTPADRFHIGSCTKSMTAVLAAMLVREGRLSWGKKLSEVFPEKMAKTHESFRGVTVEQLLSHRAGMPGNLTKEALWQRIWLKSRTLGPTDQRLFLLDGVVGNEPEAPPGTKYIYSNAGYAVAGAMIERVTGRSWEALMKRRLFAPLGMASAGFGPPASPGRVDQPWGHIPREQGPKPVPPGPGADNPPAIGPAGTVHCTIGDLAKYAMFHLEGARGQEKLLPASSFRKLHTPAAGQDYALGWVVTKRQWGGGTVLTHAGSNTMFYCVMWLAPRKRFAALAATNMGGDKAARGCDRTAAALIGRFLSKQE